MFTNLWFKILWRLEYKNHLQKIKKTHYKYKWKPAL